MLIMKVAKNSIFISIIFPCLLCAKFSFSQLIVNAGKDTTYCVGLWPAPMILGADLQIKNGVEPYTIRWECKLKLTPTLVFTASDFLNDTTLLSPLITNNISWPQWLKFIVHITDSKNNYSKDSINIRFSTFGYQTKHIVAGLERGDSIRLKGIFIGGGIEPLKYYWQPGTGLSNFENLTTWCKPDSSIQYFQIAVDSCGCVSEPNLAYDIRVVPTGVDQLSLKQDNTLNIQQKGTKIFFDNPFKKQARIILCSVDGKIQSHFEAVDDYFDVAHLLKTKGIYIVKISVGKITDSKKVLNY